MIQWWYQFYVYLPRFETDIISSLLNNLFWLILNHMVFGIWPLSWRPTQACTFESLWFPQFKRVILICIFLIKLWDLSIGKRLLLKLLCISINSTGFFSISKIIYKDDCVPIYSNKSFELFVQNCNEKINT